MNLTALPYNSHGICNSFYVSFINILALGVTMGLSPNMYRDVGDFSPISTDVIIIGGGATGAGLLVTVHCVELTVFY